MTYRELRRHDFGVCGCRAPSVLEPEAYFHLAVLVRGDSSYTTKRRETHISITHVYFLAAFSSIGTSTSSCTGTGTSAILVLVLVLVLVPMLDLVLAFVLGTSYL